LIKLPAIKLLAALEASHCPPDLANPWKLLSTTRTLIKKTASSLLNREWERVRAGFPANSQIVACLLPFGAVWRDPAAACSKLS
jgi:hypothetical protein